MKCDLCLAGECCRRILRPHFVTRDEWRQITHTCETVWSAIEKVGRIAPANKLMLEQIGLTAGERELVAIDPGYEDVSVTSRLDSFLTDESYTFVELNAECPAGNRLSGCGGGDLLRVAADARVHARASGHADVLPAESCSMRCLRSTSACEARARSRSIGIVDYKGLPTQREFELFKEFFEAEGYATTIADPRDLELREGKLHHGDFKIDLVYRRVLTTELLEKIDECRAFVDAYQTGAAVFVNSFRTKYVHKKMLFGVLTDERHQQYFSRGRTGRRSEARFPWTRKIEDAQHNSRWRRNRSAGIRASRARHACVEAERRLRRTRHIHRLGIGRRSLGRRDSKAR